MFDYKYMFMFQDFALDDDKKLSNTMSSNNKSNTFFFYIGQNINKMNVNILIYSTDRKIKVGEKVLLDILNNSSKPDVGQKVKLTRDTNK